MVDVFHTHFGVAGASQQSASFTLHADDVRFGGTLTLFFTRNVFRAPVLRPLTAWLPRPGGPRPRVLHACEAHRGDGSAKALDSAGEETASLGRISDNQSVRIGRCILRSQDELELLMHLWVRLGTSEAGSGAVHPHAILRPL